MMEQYEKLRMLAPDITFGFANDRFPADVLLVMHACPVECANVPPFDGPVLHASTWRVGLEDVPEEAFAETIVRRLKEMETGIAAAGESRKSD